MRTEHCRSQIVSQNQAGDQVEKHRRSIRLLVRFQASTKIWLQIDAVEGGKARVKAADGGMVSVELRDTNTAFATPYVEFKGIVTSPSSLREESHVNFGSTFGEQLHDQPSN